MRGRLSRWRVIMRKALIMNNLHVKDQYCRFRKRVGILKPLKRLKFRPYPTLHIFSVTYSQKSTYIPPSFYIVVYFVYIVLIQNTARARVAQWVRKLDYLSTHTRLSPIQRGFVPSFVNYKKGALDSQSQVIKITSCLPMVGGSLWVLRLLPPLKPKYFSKWR